MFSPCFGASWNVDDDDRQGTIDDVNSITPLLLKEHFGSSKITPLSNQQQWDKERIFCPLSVKHHNHRPYACQTFSAPEVSHSAHGSQERTQDKIQEKDNPIKVMPMHSHEAHHSFVYIQPAKHAHHLFTLCCTSQNSVKYLGAHGITDKMQFVKLWKWHNDEDTMEEDKKDSDSSPDNNPKSPKHQKHLKHPKHVKKHQKPSDYVVITDPEETCVLMAYKSGDYYMLQFSDSIPKDIFKCVFLSASVHEFVHVYHHGK